MAGMKEDSNQNGREPAQWWVFGLMGGLMIAVMVGFLIYVSLIKS